MTETITNLTIKETLSVVAIVISIVALIFSIFDIKLKISNFSKKQKLNNISINSLIKLLVSIYIYQKKLDRNNFFSENKQYKLNVIDNNFVDELKDLSEKYKNIYEESLFKNKKLYSQYLEITKIYNICHTYSDNLILNRFLYHGEYENNMSLDLISNLENLIINHLIKYHSLKITPNNILRNIT